MPQLKVRIGCVVLAVIMSAVTYYFVEPRLRWGRYGGYKAAGLLSCMVIIGVSGYSIERRDGYTARMDDPDQQLIDAINKRMDEDNLRCLEKIPDWKKLSLDDEITQCRFQRSEGKNTIAIIGDSHGGQLYSGLTTVAGDNEGVAVFPAGCGIPLIGLHSYPDPAFANREPYRAYTEHLLSEGFRYILSHKNLKKVLLVHAPGCSWHNVADTRNPGNHDFDSIIRDGFVRTYEALAKAGKDVYVVLDNPRNNNWAKCNAAVVRRPVSIPSFLSSKNTEVCSVQQSKRPEKQQVDNWNKVAHETSAGYNNIHYIDLLPVFCRQGICSMVNAQGKLLYRDASHLNINGSIYAAPSIIKQLRQ